MGTRYMEIFQKMIDDDNKEIALSTSITSVTTQLSSTIEFRVEPKFANSALMTQIGLPSEYMCFCLCVKRSEIENYKKLMEKIK